MAIQRADLPDQALAGDMGAWNDLIQRHNRRVIVSLLARGVPLDLALDLAQEAWARLIQQQASGKLARLELPGLAVAQARWLAMNHTRHASKQVLEVVLDVAEEATGVALGILLDGPGAVWMSDVKVKTVATTGRVNLPHDEPVNLDFTK